MLQLKSFKDISGFDAGWLKAKHHLALGPYGNPAHEAVGNLIVLNDDEIAPHTGFGLHHHENIEIVSYLREGTVTHRDDQGNLGKTHAGDVQVMSAGTGKLYHAPNNHSSGMLVGYVPDARVLFTADLVSDTFCLIPAFASPVHELIQENGLSVEMIACGHGNVMPYAQLAYVLGK
jgi:glyoxylase-like metal-dependent hydrolase (beta-lactamase superfamily II)